MMCAYVRVCQIFRHFFLHTDIQVVLKNFSDE